MKFEISIAELDALMICWKHAAFHESVADEVEGYAKIVNKLLIRITREAMHRE